MTLALVIVALVVVAGAVLYQIHLKGKTMAAIDDLNAAVANVGAYVTTLQSANVDLTPQIEAATAALTALVPPAPTPIADPVVEPVAELPAA